MALDQETGLLRSSEQAALGVETRRLDWLLSMAEQVAAVHAEDDARTSIARLLEATSRRHELATSSTIDEIVRSVAPRDAREMLDCCVEICRQCDCQPLLHEYEAMCERAVPRRTSHADSGIA